jgi:hypothetical protein
VRFDGVRYQGQWRWDKQCGMGRLEGVQGLVYVGEWSDNMLHGHGSMDFNGMHYVGEFKNNMRDGQGVVTYADGTTIVGCWKAGARLQAYTV